MARVDKDFFYNPEEGHSWAEMINDINVIMDSEITKLPNWMYDHVVHEIISKKYPFRNNELIRARAECDKNDEYNEDFARVLLARKLDYKHEDRLARQYEYLSNKFYNIMIELARLASKHKKNAEKLRLKIMKVSNDY